MCRHIRHLHSSFQRNPARRSHRNPRCRRAPQWDRCHRSPRTRRHRTLCRSSSAYIARTDPGHCRRRPQDRCRRGLRIHRRHTPWCHTGEYRALLPRTVRWCMSRWLRKRHRSPHSHRPHTPSPYIGGCTRPSRRRCSHSSRPPGRRRRRHHIRRCRTLCRCTGAHSTWSS